ncbi:MAG: TauD/TfdA family dioxygenase [Chlamydiia bacterium]|nr:TauD/TfdA family dioxygenase [Chlamydiia bacterium]
MRPFIAHFLTPNAFPLVIEPRLKTLTFRDFLSLLQEYQPLFSEKLQAYGALLFRGFPLQQAAEFEASIRSLDLGNFVDYIGGDSPRTKVTNHVYTSTEAPPWFRIPLHNELSFMPNYPRHIYFFCSLPAEEGGATPIADARRIYATINPSIRDRWQERKIRYLSSYFSRHLLLEMLNRVQPSHRSWHQVFETDSKNRVENLCRQAEFEYEWKRGNWLKLAQTRPATIEHESSQEPVWFNQAHLFDFNPRLLGRWRYTAAKLFYRNRDHRLHEVSFGDGEEIPRSEMYQVMDALEEQAVEIPWQRGDFMVLDNVLAMHGRAPFKGRRRVLTAMTR